MNTAVVLPAVLLGRAIDAAKAWASGQGEGTSVLWAGLAYAMRADALRGVLFWPMDRLYSVPIGDLMARIIGDVEVVGRGVRELTTEAWDTVLFSLSLIAGMMAYDPGLTLLTLLPVPLGLLLALSMGRWVSERTVAAREASAALTSYLQERLVGLRVVRLFGRVEATVARVAELSSRLAEASLAIVRLRSSLQPVYRLLMLGGVVFLLWLGGERVATGAMSLGALIAYLDLYNRFVNRGHRIPQLFNSVQGGAAAYARLEPLLAPPLDGPVSWRSTVRIAYVPGLDEPGPPLPERPPHPVAISLRQVTFRYPGNERPVLRRISLDIPAGGFVAVTGPVGCGKSALARVLLGLYPLEEGQVLLDGVVPLDALSPAERAAWIGYLPQTPFLFSGTVRENILFTFPAQGPQCDAELDRWLRLAALETDLQTFPKGLDTEIGERGLRVSGGQRQRIALARAFASRPALLVLDDPFSAVDLDTEAQIIAGLREAFGPAAPLEQRATVVFFSHRLGAFPLADQVVVLDRGRIVEQGAHEALLAAGGLYARIYRAQQQIKAREGM